MTKPEEQNDQESWENELLEQLGTFLKYRTIYPNNNRRVLSALGEVLATFEKIKKTHGARLVLTLHGGRFLLADVPIEADSPVKAWMHDAFVRTALGGVEFDATVGRQPLANFASQLSENYNSPEKSFAKLWGRSFRGVRPFELRFEGAQGSGSVKTVVPGRSSLVPGDRVVGELVQNEELMSKIDRLRNLLEENLPEGDAAQINLLEPIRQALPIEAMLDPQAACDLVDQILQILESKVMAMVAQEKFSDQEAMQIGLAAIGRRYFKAHVKDMGEMQSDALPEGRPEDASTVDDVDLMIQEFETLPECAPDFALTTTGPEYTREALGVYLHHLVHCESADTPAREVIKDSLRHAPENGDLVQPYVDLALSPEGLKPENRKVWRLIEVLQESDTVGLLQGKRFLTPKVVQFTFPRQFVPYLDSLRQSDREQLDAIADICRRVGAERLIEAGEYLVEEAKLVTRKRLQKLLSVDSDELLPLVSTLVNISDNWVRDAVARFIRRRNPPIKESAALRVVRPISWLTPTYLAGLCVRNPSREHRQWLQEESGRLLRVFLRDTAGNDEMEERRLRALHMLGELPSAENLEFLREVIRERRFRFFRLRARRLRKAARRTRKQMKRRLVSESR